MRILFILNLSLIFFTEICFAQKVTSNPLIDSSKTYFTKYASSDSFILRIHYLEKAIDFYPCDSLYWYLSNEYFDNGAYGEAKKNALVALKQKMQTKLYSSRALGTYISALKVTGEHLKAIKILKNNKDDSVYFKGRYIEREHISREIKDIESYVSHYNDSISFLKKQPKKTEAAYLDIAYRYSKLGKFKKAHYYFKKGLKEYPNSSALYLYKGKANLWEGKYENSMMNFSKSLSLGRADAKVFFDMARQLCDVLK
jgi:tetratricopeptide (TPR) repeat protein